MALTFPLPLATFFDGLPITQGQPDLGEALEYSQTGAGEILTADLGPRLWKADFQIAAKYYAEIEQIKAKLNTLRYAGRSLLVHSFPLKAPQYDPTGTILGAANVTLASVLSNNRDISLNGLPVGYKLTPGDFLSFQYGSNPVRYALHQVVVGGTAGAGGALNGLEVVPHVRPGYAAGAAVTLIKPVYKAVIVPGSVDAGISGSMITDGVKFSLIQTLR